MNITDLIARNRRDRDARAALYNSHGEELAELRAIDALTPEQEARATQLREERAGYAAEVAAFDARHAELLQEQRDDEAVARLESTPGAAGAPVDSEERATVVSEANPVYRRGGEASFFGDLFAATRGDRSAGDRLASSQERAVTTAPGAGGEFAPPSWIVEDFAEYARAARVTADLIGAKPLPAGISSINLPKITLGSGVAVQETQNTTITETGMTTTSVSSGIATITGKQTVSIQELRQSAIPFDQIVLEDLAAAYAAALDTQVLHGTGANGQLRGLLTAGTTVTYTTNAPAVTSTTAAASFYGKGLAALAAISGTRFLPGDSIVMHPRRWNWVLNALDGQGRPLVVPQGPAMNPAAEGAPTTEGLAGSWLGLPVYVDPNIVTNRGASTNQDVVYVLRKADLRLWESPLETASFDATLADQNSVLFRALGFAAFIPDRHAASVQVIDGTGLVAPTF